MAKKDNITNLSSEEYVLKNGTDVPKVIDYGKEVSKIVFKDGTELDIDDTNKKYFKYKDNQIKLYKSVKELTLYGDVLWGVLTIIETSDDALIDTIILNDVSGGLNTRNISVSCIKVKSIKSKFRNSFKINSNDLNLLEVYKKVDFGKLDVHLKSLKTLRNRGKIHELEVKDTTNFKSKNVGQVYINKVCMADKDGNVIFLYDEDYENLMNKLKDYLKDAKNDPWYKGSVGVYEMGRFQAIRAKETLKFFEDIKDSNPMIDFLKNRAETEYRYWKKNIHEQKKKLEEMYNNF